MSNVEPRNLVAILVVRHPERATPLVVSLCSNGFSVIFERDPELALQKCDAYHPQLAVVEDDLGKMSGSRFLAEMVKVSWTTSSILISDNDEELVHEQTEGLGLMGQLRDSQDVQGLEKALEVLGKLNARQ